MHFLPHFLSLLLRQTLFKQMRSQQRCSNQIIGVFQKDHIAIIEHDLQGKKQTAFSNWLF